MAYKFSAIPGSEHDADGKAYKADKDGVLMVENGDHAAILKRLGLKVIEAGVASGAPAPEPTKEPANDPATLETKKARLEALLKMDAKSLTAAETAEINALDAEIAAAEPAKKKGIFG